MKKQKKTIDMNKMTNGRNGVIFSHDKLYPAFTTVEDLMDRLLTPYFLHMKTAEDVKNNRLLEGDGIDVMIRDKSITQYVEDILKDEMNLMPEQIRNGFEYKVGEIPVRVKVYSRNYHFFKYPNHVVYQFGTYQLANPWDVYWKARGLIR